MRKTIWALAMTATLSACGPPSVEDYMEDPDMLSEAIDECTLEVAQGKRQSERCRNAEKAAETMGKNLLRGALPEGLGDILWPEDGQDE